MNILQIILATSLVVASSVAAAHGNQEQAKPAGPVKMEQKAWGIAGEAKAVNRTIEITMADNMRFSPGLIEVNQGDTIKLVHLNKGKVMHEFVLGTKKDLDEHAALMKKFPKMEHDEPYMAHVGPNQRGQIIWTFNKAGEFDFACLLPGHYDAGMVGKIRVAAK